MAVRKITVTHLSRLTGISRMNIYRLCNDEADNFNRQTLDKLCTVLGCLPSDLIAFIPDEQVNEE